MTFQQEQQEEDRSMSQSLVDEYNHSLQGLSRVISECWNTYESAKDNTNARLDSLKMVKECYSMRVSLMDHLFEIFPDAKDEDEEEST